MSGVRVVKAFAQERRQLRRFRRSAKDRFTGDVTIGVDVPGTTQAIVLHGRDLTHHARRGERQRPAHRRRPLPSAGGGGQATRRRARAHARAAPPRRRAPRSGSPTSAPIGDRLERPLPREGGRRVLRVHAVRGDRRAARVPVLRRAGVQGAVRAHGDARPRATSRSRTRPRSRATDASDGRARRSASRRRRRCRRTSSRSPSARSRSSRRPTGSRCRSGSSRRKRQGARSASSRSRPPPAHARRCSSDYFGTPVPVREARPRRGARLRRSARWRTPGSSRSARSCILLDPTRASTARSAAHGRASSAHELAHQWFGNLVTMRVVGRPLAERGLRHLDGGARSSTRGGPSWARGLERSTRQAAVMERRRARLGARGAPAGREHAARPRRRSTASPTTRAPRVLGHARAWLGEDAFRDGVRAYLKAHEHGSATAADLFRALGQAAGRDVWRGRRDVPRPARRAAGARGARVRDGRARRA